MAFSDNDVTCMQRALELAWAAKGSTFPNPAVGAVIVNKKGEVVGEGMTDVCGGPHAEVRALRKAGAKARGGAMYVTLEPCAHFGRTPPCTDAIIAAGISRVVAAVRDPNPLVVGKGIRQLKKHGIAVQTGLLKYDAAAVNEDFFWSVTQKRPWVTLKLAMTLDGRIADDQGGSKWISSPASRRLVQDIRRCHGAIAVGKNTLLADDPKLTARCGKKIYYPSRIIFSSDTYIPPKSYVFSHRKEARTIVVVKGRGKKGIDIIDNIEYWRTGSRDSAESINIFLGMAYEEGLTSILVEGGAKLASAFLENGFVNKAYLFYGNKVFGGGAAGISFSNGLPVAGCLSLKNVIHRSVGDDFLVSGYALPTPPCEFSKKQKNAPPNKKGLRRQSR